MTVIDARMYRSAAKNARLAMLVTAGLIGVPTAVVLAEAWHPVTAIPVATIAGLVAGALAWAAVRSWVLLRWLWWWLPELGLTTLLVAGWVWLSDHAPVLVHLAVTAALVALVALVGPVRRHLVAWVWCLVVRHRLRVCFTQFIITNRTGSLPLILWAHPTPVGERVWIYLRPGLSVADLERRLDKIAVACHAATVLVEAASTSTAAYLRVDIKRREVLDATIGNPLAGLADPTIGGQGVLDAAAPAGTGLDLPEVSAPARPEKPTSRLALVHPTPLPKPKPSPTPESSPARQPVRVPPADTGEDLTDWI